MRRVIGFTLAGLGVLLLLGALLVRAYVAGQVIKFPLDERFTSTLQGTGVSYFSPSRLKPVSGATVRVTDTITGDAAAGSPATAVWNESTSVYDVSNSAPIQSSARRAAFDRRTSQLVACCGSSVSGDTQIRQSGLSGYVWPIGTQKQTYYVFDTVLHKPMPYRYEGTATVGGIPAYRFVERVPLTRSGGLTLPAALLGIKGQVMVTIPEYYAATNTDWVDPETGAILKVSENQALTLRDAAGRPLVVLFSGALSTSVQSVRQAVTADSAGRTEVTWLVNNIPLVSGLVGLAALIAGVLLVRRRREVMADPAEAPQPEPAVDPVP